MAIELRLLCTSKSIPKGADETASKWGRETDDEVANIPASSSRWHSSSAEELMEGERELWSGFICRGDWSGPMLFALFLICSFDR